MADFTIREDEISPAEEAEPLSSNTNESNNDLIYWNFRSSRSFPSYIGELADTYQLEEWAYETPQERDP